MLLIEAYVANIFIPCAKCIPELLKIHPTAFFGFIGARSIDVKSDKIEGHKKTSALDCINPTYRS
jgi:hypothetical protein